MISRNGERILFEQEIQQDLKRKSIEPEEFTDRIIFMSMFNDIELTKRGNTEKCIFEFRTRQELREEVLARTLVISRPWRREEMVWNSQLYA